MAPQGRWGHVGRLAALVGALGPAVSIVVVVIAGLVWPGYDAIASTQSEFGAVDSPVRWWTNIGSFAVLGVGLVAATVAYCTLPRPSPWRVVGAALLLLAGVGMLAVSQAPCDPGCIDVTSTGRWHSVLSAPSAIALPVAMMVSAPALRADGSFSARWQRPSFVLGGVLLVSGPVIALELVAGVAGLVQRASMWTAAMWVAVLSWRPLALAGQPRPARSDASLGR